MESELVSYDNDCCRDIPMDMLYEIFLYLPVKSLVRFTCVCKSWLYLIREPQFAVKHYLFRTSKHSKLNNVDYLVDYFGKCRRGCSSTCSEQVSRCCMYSLSEKKTFRLAKKIEFGHDLDVFVSNFCHGILCVLVRDSSVPDAKFLLHNPAIREVVPIPAFIDTVIYGRPRFGLGFDPTSNNYKIVAIHPPVNIAKQNHRADWVVNVYCVRNGSWHNVQATTLEKLSSLDGEPALNNNGRTLNWLGRRKSNEKKSLVSFDIIDEVFKETSLPECVCLRQYQLLSCSNFQAVVCCSSYTWFDLSEKEHFNCIYIWVLNGNEGDKVRWSKHVSFRFPYLGMAVWPMNIWMNNKELLVYVKKNWGASEIFHYDIGTQELKRTGRSRNLMNPDVYTESLVSIKGLVSSSVATSNGVNASQKHKDNNESNCFIREVGRRNDDIRWSYYFNLSSRCS